MLTAAQLRAARALLGVDQRQLAELSDLSVPTIQRMEASEGVIRGNVEFADEAGRRAGAAGIELIGEGAPSAGGGRGVRLKGAARRSGGHGAVGSRLDLRRRLFRHRRPRPSRAPRSRAPTAIVYGAPASPLAGRARQRRALSPARRRHAFGVVLPLGLPWLGAHFRIDALVRLLPRRRQSRRRGGEPLRASATAGTRREPQRVLPFFPAFLAGMNLVVARRRRLHLPARLGIHVARLLGAGDGASSRAPTMRAPAMSISSWRASAPWRCCSPSACSPAPAATTPSPRCAAIGASAGVAALVLGLALLGAGIEGGPRAAACLAAARPSRRAEPCLRADERRHDQGRGLRLHPHRLRSARAAGLVVGRCRCSPSAAATAVLGVLYALMQNDLKRVLAYSTIENIGVIFVGLGLASPSRPTAFSAAAALALTAALFHVFNHALFKSLLFFGAGAVLTATGEREMERLGGLIHTMPATGLVLPHRLRRHLRAAAAQRLRLRMADVSGDPAQPAAAAMGR